jgi:hypothetical protein
VPPGARYFGSPAVELARQKRIIAALYSLPEQLKTIRSLEKRIAELEAQIGTSGVSTARGGNAPTERT